MISERTAASSTPEGDVQATFERMGSIAFNARSSGVLLNEHHRDETSYLQIRRVEYVGMGVDC
jgi:hypothetical protein